MVTVGNVVTYTDPKGIKHAALVTANWGEGDTPSLNVVYMDSDENKTDSYGRQIARSTSTPHKSNQAAPGNYWTASN